MKRWISSGIVIVGGAMVIACGDQRPDAPAGPVASVTALTTVPACDLSGASSLVAQYFNVSDAKTVRDKLNAMALAGEGSEIARNAGFDIIAIIATNAQAGTGGDASKASDLINQITPCMFRTLAALPETDHVDYTVAIAGAAGGLGVRGGDNRDSVVSRGGFSGVAPQSGETWASTLGSNPAPRRVAFFGRPVLNSSLSYDWTVLPRDAEFVPPVVVGLCLNEESFPTSMIHDSHRGLLAYVAADFLNTATCIAPSSTSAFSAITGQLAQLFLPQRLLAAAGTRGIGGSSGGIGTEYSANVVPSVSLEFLTPPPTTVTVLQTFPLPGVEVRATHPVTHLPLPGTSISIFAINNNGERKELGGKTTDTTDTNGFASFNDLSFGANSTGGFRLVVAASVINRPAIKGQLTSKINVRPAKK